MKKADFEREVARRRAERNGQPRDNNRAEPAASYGVEPPPDDPGPAEPPAEDAPPAEEIDGARLLDELRDTITAYVVFADEHPPVAVALWIATTHALPAFECAPRLV